MILAGLSFARAWLFWAALFICLAGILDVLDGQVARSTHITPAGAFLDSVMDRWGELFLFLGLAFLFRDTWLLYVVIAGFGGAVITSYARARAEGLGEKCREGFFQRPERLIVLGAAAILNYLINLYLKSQTLLPLKLGVIAVAALSLFTAAQRTSAVYKTLKYSSKSASG